MQTKNKIKIFIIFFISLLFFNLKIYADEFNISAKELLIDKDNEILVGKGSVTATDSEGKLINADKITYQKLKEFLLIEGNVKIIDVEGNILETSKATYDKLNNMILTFDNTKILLSDDYNLLSKNIAYNVEKKILSSSYNSILTDKDGNVIEVSMFQYDINNNLFSSVGEIKIKDISKNKYFFKEIHIDTKKKEMIGSDVSVALDEENFGLDGEFDPRFVANDISISGNKTTLSKGIFTVCKKEGEKCPPWTLRAKKIIHDKAKKTIYYEHATLKVFDIPLFYFPRFFHPDPTVKRQSGFLPLVVTNSTNLGLGFTTPYFWAIDKDKDLTFSPKIYTKEKILFLNEYRQAFKNGFLTLDTGYTEGYKNISKTKTGGSRNHIFADLNLISDSTKNYESNFFATIQRASNNTYFRKHDINTELVKAENTTLSNEIKYTFSKNDMFFDVSANIYQDLRKKKNSDQYEMILPNIIFGKNFFTEKFGNINFKTDTFYTKYETNKEKSFLTNDIIWNPSSLITKNGFLNTLEGMLRNTNYQTKNTNEYKDDKTINELAGVVSYKSSLPLKKDSKNFTNIFSPNIMLRYAPGSMRKLNEKDITLNYENLYALNKTAEIERGLSAILGLDFKIDENMKNNSSREKISLSIGQVFNYEENKDMPSKSSLDQKMSDVVGKINYNFSEIGSIDYKFSVDHNLNDINYNEVSSKLNFGKIQFNIDYLEEQNHRGEEHYASSGISLNFNNNNRLTFSTKKNFKTESTELYNLDYQYSIDCLTAGLAYRREFYQDDDMEQKNSLMFTITFVPFAKVKSPEINE